MKSRTKAYIALFTNSLIWGSALPLIKLGFTQISPMVFLFYRYVFACLTSIPIIIIYWHKIKFKLKDLPQLLALGFFSTVLAHAILYQGFAKTGAIEASILTCLIPIFIIISASIFLKEKISKTEKIGSLIAFLGSLFIIIEPLIFQETQITKTNSLGNFLILFYNIIWTISVLWMKKIAKKFHPFTISLSSFITGFIGFAILAYFENPNFLRINYFDKPLAFTSFIYMGTLGTTLALFLYQYAQTKIEASEAVLFTYLQALFVIPLSILLLQEKITPVLIVSSAIIIIGIIIAEKRWHSKS